MLWILSDGRKKELMFIMLDIEATSLTGAELGGGGQGPGPLQNILNF